MAETFVAVRRGPGRFEQTVCIKRILPGLESDAEFVASFLDEARTSATLRHTNIVQVLDFGVANDSHYLALELVDGVDLRALLRGQRGACAQALPAELVVLVAFELAAALAHAHGPDPRRPTVAHRDISPSNVLVSRAGEIKLTDFGIARAEHITRRTRSGVLKGKVPYMPPEYIEHGEFDARSDLFSLGVLLYELLMGRRPFDGASDIDTVRRILAGQAAGMPAPTSELERVLQDCISRLIAVAPDARFQSAAQLADALPDIATHRTRSRLVARVQEELSPIQALAITLQPAPAGDAHAETLLAPQAPRPNGAPRIRRIPTQQIRHLQAIAHSAPTRTRAPIAAGYTSPWVLVALAVGAVASGGLLWAGARAAAGRARVTERERSDALGARVEPSVPADSQPVALAPAPSAPASVVAGALSSPPTGPSAIASANKSAPRSARREPQVAEEDAPPTTLRVVAIPYGDVWIDGAPVGTTPISLPVKRGSHRVEVGAGRPMASTRVRARSGEISLTFRRTADDHYSVE
jgi:serine/threonine protein kinase